MATEPTSNPVPDQGVPQNGGGRHKDGPVPFARTSQDTRHGEPARPDELSWVISHTTSRDMIAGPDIARIEVVPASERDRLAGEVERLERGIGRIAFVSSLAVGASDEGIERIVEHAQADRGEVERLRKLVEKIATRPSGTSRSGEVMRRWARIYIETGELEWERSPESDDQRERGA